ncbi:MAG TPA: hypothetical protein DCS20_02405 [Candidatus Yonathbacteria bacterium]|nr:hypothetical protein [Candidatus Yonathbacteria bacterium]
MTEFRFLIAKDIYPHVFTALSEALKTHVLECPDFTEKEVGFLVLVLLREKVICFDPNSKTESFHQFEARDSIAIQNFILKAKSQFVELYETRRRKLLR